MKVCDVIKLNKVVKKIKSEKSQIVFPRLELNSTELITYIDASFNNLPRGGSHSGHVIFLTSNGKKCCTLVWNSKKVQSTLGS